MKDRTIILLVVFGMFAITIGVVSYAMFFHDGAELSAAELAERCGPGTVFDATSQKCVVIETEGEEGPPKVQDVDCDIEDMTLKFRGLLKRTKGDAIKYVNTTYEVWQFGDEQGRKVVSVADWGSNSAYHEDITTLTPQYPIVVWWGEDGDTAPDHWIRTGGKDTGCQAAVSFTGEVVNESHPTQGTGFSIEYYDGGTYEATANESVSPGETVADSYFKIKEASGDASVGHPDIENPIGYCFAYNNTEVLRARLVDGDDFPVLSALGGTADECWEWDHDELFDYKSDSVDLVLEFKSTMSDGEPGEVIAVYLVTKNYYKDGSGNWKIGWEDDDDSLLGMGDTTADLNIAYY
jgi:hypothetical protein